MKIILLLLLFCNCLQSQAQEIIDYNKLIFENHIANYNGSIFNGMAHYKYGENNLVYTFKNGLKTGFVKQQYSLTKYANNYITNYYFPRYLQNNKIITL